MSLNNQSEILFKGFSKLDRNHRLKRLQQMGALDEKDYQSLLNPTTPPMKLAENFIENVIGYFQLPLGIGANLCIDGEDYAIPMAVEETSIIASISKTARWVREKGQIKTTLKGKASIGQIQIARLKDINAFKNIIENNQAYLIQLANTHAAPGLIKRGGGVIDIEIKTIARPDAGTMGILHVHVNTCDAMGANIITQICEYLKEPVEQLTGESVTMCILTNLVDSKLTEAKVILEDIDPAVGEGIAEASLFASLDPYRATTHNKGILNGIDPVLIATGNDWRAVEAGMHAYAAREGQYKPLSTWCYESGTLTGVLEAPIILGTVGGVTQLHPNAQMAMRILDVKNAEHLARIIAAVGLVQNLGALKALSTVGLVEGHMKLHISNLSLSAGANDAEQPLLQKRLQQLLKLTNRVTLTHALELLTELRKELHNKEEQIV